MDPEEQNCLGQPSVLSADQCLKAFNCFVVFSVFTNGGFAGCPS